MISHDTTKASFKVRESINKLSVTGATPGASASANGEGAAA